MQRLKFPRNFSQLWMMRQLGSVPIEDIYGPIKNASAVACQDRGLREKISGNRYLNQQDKQ